jgi:diphthamide synthase (EF-2-diphthine--ammonia ligase)
MRSYEPSQLRGKILDLIDQSLEEYEAHVHCDNPEYQTVVLENPL